MPEDEYDNSKKAHVKRKAGKKAEKKKSKDGHEQVRRFILLMKDHQPSFFSGTDCKAAKPEGLCSAEYHQDRTEGEKKRGHQ